MADDLGVGKQEIEWVDEYVENDGVFRGGAFSSGESSMLFRELPQWHRSFFYSLKFKFRIEKALFQLDMGGKRARELFSSWKYSSGEALSSDMEIRKISEMIFPLPMFGMERKIFEREIISCIEKHGMKATWSLEGRKKGIDGYVRVSVNINNIEEMIRSGFIKWEVAKYLRVWRYYLEEKERNVEQGIKFTDDKQDKLNEQIQNVLYISENWGKYKLNFERKTVNAVFKKVAEMEGGVSVSWLYTNIPKDIKKLINKQKKF